MDLFGDSSDDDGPSSTTIAMITAARQRELETSNSELSEKPPENVPSTFDSSLKSLFPMPLASGPIDFTEDLEDYGGGRSFIASADLPPGTMLMKEVPMAQWPSESIGKALSVGVLRSIADLSVLKNLHPKVLSDLPSVEVEKHRNSMKDELEELSKETNVPIDELLRCYFTLTCNGFDSGIYGFLSIFNHSESPNCIKFSPSEGVPFSEVRTVKPVKKGDHLTISYMNPREQSFSRRRKYFLSQHYFDVSIEIRDLPVIQKFDATNRSAEEVENTEKSIDEFTKMHDEIKLVNDEAGKANTAFAFEIKEKMALKCRDLYAASEELRGAVFESFDEHVIAIRCLRLHTNICAVMLDLAGTPGKVLIDEMEGTNILCDFVKSTSKLLDLQKSYHEGDTHPDIGSTYLDLAEGISALLSKAPERLFALKIPRLSSLVASSKYESELRQRQNKIANLYK
mmetsp:Transcript_4177/g.8410  ORF Transcript_4177/g.8410 Transcript_4177/m.8410 type:complete len:456 (+) Transcript_4177:27-1394(+)